MERKNCKNEKSELSWRSMEDYGVCMVHMQAGSSGMNVGCCHTHGSPRKCGVNKSIQGWRELASLLNCKEGAAVDDGGQTEQLSCGHAGGAHR